MVCGLVPVPSSLAVYEAHRPAEGASEPLLEVGAPLREGTAVDEPCDAESIASDRDALGRDPSAKEPEWPASKTGAVEITSP